MDATLFTTLYGVVIFFVAFLIYYIYEQNEPEIIIPTQKPQRKPSDEDFLQEDNGDTI